MILNWQIVLIWAGCDLRVFQFFLIELSINMWLTYLSEFHFSLSYKSHLFFYVPLLFRTWVIIIHIPFCYFAGVFHIYPSITDLLFIHPISSDSWLAAFPVSLTLNIPTSSLLLSHYVSNKFHLSFSFWIEV